MGPYYIPRNVNDEGRILFIFTGKSLIFTAAGAGIGFIFYLLFSLFNLVLIGMISVAIFAAIGFGIGTLKIPNGSSFRFSKKLGGENVYNIILRAIKFKMRKNRIYIYGNEEDTKDE